MGSQDTAEAPTPSLSSLAASFKLSSAYFYVATGEEPAVSYTYIHHIHSNMSQACRPVAEEGALAVALQKAAELVDATLFVATAGCAGGGVGGH
jgi:hypothetical protein